MNAVGRGAGIASIVNQYQDPVASILTVYMDGEKPAQLVERLKAALEAIPFRTLFSYVMYDHMDSAHELLRHATVDDVEDYPGAKKVALRITLSVQSDLYLPRDLRTGEFVSIGDQIQCIAALALPLPGEREEADTWFEETRQRLGLSSDWRIVRVWKTQGASLPSAPYATQRLRRFA